MPSTTIRQAQRAIDLAGIPLEIVRGEGYHYFVYDRPEQNIFEDVSEYVCYTNTYTPAEWAEIARSAFAAIQSRLERREARAMTDITLVHHTRDYVIEFPVPVGIGRALHAFLTDWLAWVDDGAHEPHRCFIRSAGLCSNALRWFGTNHTTEYDAYDAREDLIALFGEDCYPFGRGVFFKRSRNRTQHLDPNRLAWVRAVLAANPEPISNTED